MYCHLFSLLGFVTLLSCLPMNYPMAIEALLCFKEKVQQQLFVGVDLKQCQKFPALSTKSNSEPFCPKFHSLV